MAQPPHTPKSNGREGALSRHIARAREFDFGVGRAGSYSEQMCHTARYESKFKSQHTIHNLSLVRNSLLGMFHQAKHNNTGVARWIVVEANLSSRRILWNF